MNDFENRIRRAPLRTPPSEWRDQILATSSSHQTWREQVWPSFSAWAALAAVWLVLIAIERFTDTSKGVPPPAPAVTNESPPSDSLLAFHAALNSSSLQPPFHCLMYLKTS